MEVEFEALKDEALRLLSPFEIRYYSTLGDVHWVRQDGRSTDGYYCSNCIDQAVKDTESNYKNRKQEILDKYKEIEETGQYKGEEVRMRYTDAQIQDSRNYEMEQLGDHEFDYAISCGGYEAERFLTCDSCGRELCVSILPNEQELQYVLDDLENGVIDDQTGYRAYCLLYNAWDDRDEKHTEEIALHYRLAKRVIEILNHAAN